MGQRVIILRIYLEGVKQWIEGERPKLYTAKWTTGGEYMTKRCDRCNLINQELNVVKDDAGVHILDFCDSCYESIAESQKGPRLLAPDERAGFFE